MTEAGSQNSEGLKTHHRMRDGRFQLLEIGKSA
ncbi:MAG: hypothetical protein JWQ71_4740 [Pedosphaera sp.]|nr:hypothetical protein [Pedosphaera sp.]